MAYLPATLIEIVIFSLILLFFPYLGIILSILASVAITLSMLRKTQPSTLRKTIRAVIYDTSAPKGFTLVENYPTPGFTSAQMIVKVRSAAINPVDYKVITPKFPFLRWLIPHTVGRDFSGVVVEAGSQVKNFRVGDEVFGKALGGTLQEYTVITENDVARKPSRKQEKIKNDK